MTIPDSTTARTEILDRVRSALTGSRPVPSTVSRPDTDVAPTGGTDSSPGGTAPAQRRTRLSDRFVERVEDYRATVRTCGPADLAGEVASALHGANSVIIPTGFEREWTKAVSARIVDEAEVPDVHDVEGVAAVLTTSVVAIAETGTIILDHGPGQGRRGLSLLPDRHVCVVHTHQVVPGVPDAVGVLRSSIEAGRPLTWISGPSATSDIELVRVEGVHGPRTLIVILVTS